jgi:hypothetical protein
MENKGQQPAPEPANGKKQAKEIDNRFASLGVLGFTIAGALLGAYIGYGVV